MLALAPIEGVVEWCCAPGQRVEAGQVLGWLAGPGRCGLVPMTAPGTGVVTWRRAAELPDLAAGEPGVVLGDDPAGLARAIEAQRRAALAELGRVEAELDALEARGATPLARALLEPQRATAGRRRRALSALLAPPGADR